MADVTEEIVSTSQELSRCCAFLAGAAGPLIGLDTEFVGEETYHPRLCLVQVATPSRLFLIDPLTTGPLDDFWKLLLDPDRVVVVHAGRELIEETGWQAKRVDVLLTGPASAGISSERIAFARATGLQRIGAGGGVGHEQIEVHEVPVADAPAWLMRKGAEGYELDLKLWAGLWLLDRNPDGSPSP